MDKEMEKKINFLANLRCLYRNGNKPGYVSVIDDIITSLQQGEEGIEKIFEYYKEENEKLDSAIHKQAFNYDNINNMSGRVDSIRCILINIFGVNKNDKRL